MNKEEEELKKLLEQSLCDRLNAGLGKKFIQDLTFSLIGKSGNEENNTKINQIIETLPYEFFSQNQKDTLLATNLNTIASFSLERITSGLNSFFLVEEKENPVCTIKKSSNDLYDLTLSFSHKEPLSVLKDFFWTISNYNLTFTEIGGFSYHKKNGEKITLILATLQSNIALDIDDLSLEMSFLPTFSSRYTDESFRKNGLLRHFLRSFICVLEQFFAPCDTKKYTYSYFEDACLNNFSLIEKIFELFYLKFHPKRKDTALFQQLKMKLEENQDPNYQDIINFGIAFSTHLLKTNFFLPSKKAIGFRFDPEIIASEKLKKTYHHRPFSIFYIYSLDFFGFHVRFQDIARGGLRTVVPTLKEGEKARPLIFQECYQLAWTQDRKNKDIPEGGAKGIIFVDPKASSSDFYSSQKAYIETLISLVNWDKKGFLRESTYILDYYNKEELIFLGPDENMHNYMIEWIADYSKKSGYTPSIAFISGKPKTGINHKEYGVTSYGIHICIKASLQFLGIDPDLEPFTIKMVGGPDGDVAGNEIINLLKFHPKTAKLVCILDISGIMYDPNGIDLNALQELFKLSQPISYYPKEKLNDNGFLLEKETINSTSILWEKKDGKLFQRKPSTSEYDELIGSFIHKTKADLFFPAGGRPRTLNETNVHEFFLNENSPSSKVIVEGANLYLSHGARSILEKNGVIIIKDSSANKGGVICSSYEVLSGLILSEDEFIEHKSIIVEEILEKIRKLCSDEVNLILKIHTATGKSCSDISIEISDTIHKYNHEIMDYIASLSLKDNKNLTPLFDYALPIFCKKYKERLIEKLSDSYKKAIISAYTSSSIVYTHGISSSTSLKELISWID